ncbi:MAG: alpha/beta hydrolase [Candidatus Eisenbacteria bacterium]
MRRYGTAPFGVAVVHGGPGAGGGMAPVARRLARQRGVLEPIQTADSLKGQVEELTAVLESEGGVPVTLIGFSWGAWLSFIVAARRSPTVKKLVLVGSGPYLDEYAARIRETRLARLSEEEKSRFEAVVSALSDPATQDKDSLLEQLGALTFKTDAYDPIADESGDCGALPVDGDVFQAVSKDAAETRRSGELLALAARIECPVLAIHGDHDPHPAEGVSGPLSALLRDFRFVLRKSCGHKPWIERHAREEFYRILDEELC